MLLTEAAGDDVYLALESLRGIALSYHSMKSMSPYVLEGWRALPGLERMRSAHAIKLESLSYGPDPIR